MMNHAALYLLVMYGRAGRTIHSHTPLILTAGTLSALIIVFFFVRGHRSRRAADATVTPFPSNVLAIHHPAPAAGTPAAPTAVTPSPNGPLP
jgi:hypothetical protein